MKKCCANCRYWDRSCFDPNISIDLQQAHCLYKVIIPESFLGKLKNSWMPGLLGENCDVFERVESSAKLHSNKVEI